MFYIIFYPGSLTWHPSLPSVLLALNSPGGQRARHGPAPKAALPMQGLTASLPRRPIGSQLYYNRQGEERVREERRG